MVRLRSRAKTGGSPDKISTDVACASESSDEETDRTDQHLTSLISSEKPSATRTLIRITKKSYEDVKYGEAKPFLLSQSKTALSALPTLLTDNFTEEQIWAQIQLQNSDCFKLLKKSVKLLNLPQYSDSKKLLLVKLDLDVESGSNPDKLKTKKTKKRRNIKGQEEEEEAKAEAGDSESKQHNSDDRKTSKKLSPEKTPSRKSSVIDDEFFTLDDMEAFCDKAERDNFLDEYGTGLNIEEEEDGEDEDCAKEGVYYRDFFTNEGKMKKKEGIIREDKKKVGNSDLDDDNEQVNSTSDDQNEDEEGIEEDEEQEEEMDDDKNGDGEGEKEGENDGEKGDIENGPKSSFQMRNEKLRNQIADLEEDNVVDKPWQMMGERMANQRPENSLLEEHLAFQHATKVAPVITQDHTETIEQLIMQRIKDRAWDDVERKEKPKINLGTYRNELVLDGEKPKTSLAEVYEQEYVKQQEKEEESKDNPRHVEIQSALSALFTKLDALTNYHNRPREPEPELKVVRLGRVQVEDVGAPVTATTEDTLAPEEIQPSLTGDLKSTAERTDEDRRRERRRKKQLQRERAHRREMTEVRSTLTGDKKKALAKLGKVRKPTLDADSASGKADFFNKLQKDVNASIDRKRTQSSPPKQSTGKKRRS